MALYTFCESTTDPDALSRLRDTLLEYLDVFEDFSERASCVVFFKPPEADLDEAAYNERFWNILQFLHEHDPEPWPDDIPTDPDDCRWEFCFGGEPIFPTARAPFYEKRQSRHNPHGLEITAQPRKVFEGIAGHTERGEKARDRIRSRLEDYDDVPPHPDLGDWGNPGDREWKQYMLPEHNDHSHQQCPIEIST